MWQKKREEKEELGLPRESERPIFEDAASRVKSGNKQGTRIGESIYIKGELSGNEDLEIEGKVEGKIRLESHDLMIGETGNIEAEVIGKNVRVAGKVIGNIAVSERLEIKSTGSVTGDLKAPRIVIEDGANFKGSVEMEEAPATVTASYYSRKLTKGAQEKLESSVAGKVEGESSESGES